MWSCLTLYHLMAGLQRQCPPVIAPLPKCSAFCTAPPNFQPGSCPPCARTVKDVFPAQPAGNKTYPGRVIHVNNKGNCLTQMQRISHIHGVRIFMNKLILLYFNFSQRQSVSSHRKTLSCWKLFGHLFPVSTG